MSQLDEILAFNQQFVKNKAYVPYEAGGRPVKKMTIVTCMDCRLIELLPKALNIKNGDAIMLKCAGGMIESPYSSTMKSILVSLYELGSEAVYVIGHTNCGMHGLESAKMIQDIKNRGIDDDAFSAVREQGVDPYEWLGGFQSVDDQVQKSVSIVKNHPLLPEETPVYGLVIDPKTGELRLAK
ncbi:carbonic anhydrase [Sporolactobacillus sp. THM7-4]|nr:carbonic anhydrase [Sporolactobacillus sp. THM7-4]